MIRAFVQSVTFFVTVSIIVHILVATGIYTSDSSLDPKGKKEEVEITIVDNSQKKINAQQIVEQSEKRLNDETPDDAKFLSRFNQVVKKETQAAQVGKFVNSTGRGASGGPAQESRRQPVKNSHSKTEKGELPSLKNLIPKFELQATENNRMENQSSGQASQNDDHLKKTPVGMETVLSTSEFLYYTYYARIKDKIRMHWEPMIKDKVTKIIKQGRNIASNDDRITKVVIVLNNEGTLEKVQIIGVSGVTDLDDAAVEAFKAAAPFPNPPKGMVEKDGKIRIRWDFILEANSLPRIQFNKTVGN